jgi:hypothetical protein
MGHFAIPLDGNRNADYIVDNKMCVGSVGRMIVAPGQSAEIALCCAEGLGVLSNNPNVIENPIPEESRDGVRMLKIKPKAQTGGAYIDFGVLNPDGWSWAPGSPWPGKLLVNVEPRKAVVQAKEGLIQLSGPSMALNATDTPVPFKLKKNQKIGSSVSAEQVISAAASAGALKHLVFSCHGYVPHDKDNGKILDSIIQLGAGLKRSNTGLFSQLKSSMAGGIIWACGCAIGNDDSANEERARNSGCYFVAPVMFMQPGKGYRWPKENQIDMYKRFMPKVYRPTGHLMNWDVFVDEMGSKLGFKIV